MFKFIKVFLLVAAVGFFLSACDKNVVSNNSPIEVRSNNKVLVPEEQAEIIIDNTESPATIPKTPEENHLKNISKLQICPDIWIENKMPREIPGVARDYFIIGGERRELKEFDMVWIEENCDLVKQIVN